MKKLTTIAAFASGLALLAGCGGERPSEPAAAPAAPDFAAEAAKDIDAKNMDRHLEELEAAIAADEAAVEN